VSVPDIVNAAWAARSVLDEAEAQRPVAEQGRLLQSDRLSAHEKRLRLDSLASKAIDTIELSRLWGADHGVIHAGDVDVGVPLDSAGSAGVGVLSRRGIAARLASAEPRSRLVVTPLFLDSVQDAAIDVRLGPDFIVFRHSATAAFDPLSQSQDPRMLQERVHKAWGETFILHPRELVLAATLEYIVLPDDVAAQVVTRSSYGRLGLMTATAVQVQPGSRGCITLELVNHGETPIALTPASRVAQLMLWGVTDPCRVTRGKYWFPVGPEFSKVVGDGDAEALRDLARAIRESADSVQGAKYYKLSYAGPESESELFYDYACREGATEIRPDLSRLQHEHRLGPSEILAGLMGVAATVQQISMTILRWQQARAVAVVLSLDDEGELVVTSQPDLPRGTMIVRDLDGAELHRFVGPHGNAADFAETLRRLLGRRPDGGSQGQ
jgi:deoxycytidine triphosphate deaminase